MRFRSLLRSNKIISKFNIQTAGHIADIKQLKTQLNILPKDVTSAYWLLAIITAQAPIVGHNVTRGLLSVALSSPIAIANCLRLIRKQVYPRRETAGAVNLPRSLQQTKREVSMVRCSSLPEFDNLSNKATNLLFNYTLKFSVYFQTKNIYLQRFLLQSYSFPVK